MSPWLQRELVFVDFDDLPECVIGRIALAGGVPLMASLAKTSPRMLHFVIEQGAVDVMHLRLCFDCLRVSFPAVDPYGCQCQGDIRVYCGVGQKLLPIGHRLLMVLMCHLAMHIHDGWHWEPLTWVPPCTKHCYFPFLYHDFPPWYDPVPRHAPAYSRGPRDHRSTTGPAAP